MNVLITGVSSGIGNAVKDYFIKNGHNVYALDVNYIEEEQNLKFFLADVTEVESLYKIKYYLENKNIMIDVIINVAGIHMMTSLVESDCNMMRKVVDVNVSGVINVNRIFHSTLSKNGRIIIVTSEVAYLDPMPFNGLYNTSKTALECYAQALRQELNLIGQKVITIRPGAVKTPLSDGSLDGTSKLASQTRLYKKQSKKFLRIVKKFMGKPIDANVVAELIYNVSLKKHPKLVYKIHRNPGLVLLNILPLRLQLFIIKLLLHN